MKFLQSLALLLLTACCGRAQTFSKLYDFSRDTVGKTPAWQLVQGPGGVLYGQTFNGLGSSWGTIFGINTNGTGFTNVWSLSYGEGAFPYGGVISSGNTLYGTASEGGTSYGSVYAINPVTGFTDLYIFSGNDGADPEAGLVLSGTTLYGTTQSGGTNGDGTIFAIQTDSTGFTNLYNFSGLDGDAPEAAMILSGGRLYGTTYAGGTNTTGSVFAINTNGTGFTNLYSFTGFNGYFPKGSLVLSGQTLYGTTLQGGTNGNGEVFSLNTDGTGFTNLYSFRNAKDGANPYGGLVLSDRTLYGATYAGGTNGYGCIFSIHTDGTGFTDLYSFTNGADGANPEASLLLSGNTLYGTAYRGGTNDVGTIFSLTLPTSVSPPSLTVHFSGTNLIVTWPDTASGYILESITNLASSGIWNTNSTAPAIVNGFYTVTNSVSGSKMFYRLSQPSP
jgi:uncharacterized repeat protein (TIGR03803 family)